MSAKRLRQELSKLRQQIAISTPPPVCDIFAEIRKYAMALAIVRTGAAVPPDMAEVVEDAREFSRNLAAVRAEADTAEG